MASRAKILIIDDHADTVGVLCRLLRMEGYECESALSFADAIRAAVAARFDLLLCDVGLPDGNGCDLLREVQAIYSVPGIALTGFGMPGELDEISRAGFVARLVKPVDFAMLRTAVSSALAGRVMPADPESEETKKERGG